MNTIYFEVAWPASVRVTGKGYVCTRQIPVNPTYGHEERQLHGTTTLISSKNVDAILIYGPSNSAIKRWVI